MIDQSLFPPFKVIVKAVKATRSNIIIIDFFRLPFLFATFKPKFCSQG